MSDAKDRQRSDFPRPKKTVLRDAVQDQETSLTVNLPGLPPAARALKLAQIEAGTFSMGADERGSDASEQPVHTVIISRPFYLGETLVTQAQWRAVMGSLPDPVPPTQMGVSSIGMGDDVPVDSVSSDDVAAFLKALGEITGDEYRLPTEAEWEYACRGGTQTRFSFGDSLDAPDGCSDADVLHGRRTDFLWYCANMGIPNTDEWGGHAVAQKEPNGFGLYDMHGNFFELCSDWYSDDFYSRSESRQPDPENADTSTGKKVIRGGCWRYPFHLSRSALRHGVSHDKPDWATSFRIAKTITG